MNKQKKNKLFSNRTGQVAFETMLGAGIFLLVFIGVAAFIAFQQTQLNQENTDLIQKNNCFVVAQAFYETKNSFINWIGYSDNNIYVYGNTLYVNYTPGTAFSGTYCQTLDTNIYGRTIVAGDVNLSYKTGNGFIITP